MTIEEETPYSGDNYEETHACHQCSSVSSNEQTDAVSYLNASGDVYRLSRLMGHTSVKVTEVYLRAASNRSARQGISVLDAM